MERAPLKELLPRIEAAYAAVRDDLLAERCAAGHWRGHLASSALSTATAVSALSIVRQSGDSSAPDQATLDTLIEDGLGYLIKAQNADGGWGDTDKSLSNIATSMLARAAIHLSGTAEQYSDELRAAEAYIERLGGVAGLRRRYGKDKTFAVPILTNCALAGLADWKEISPLPFELACFPQSLFRFLSLPVVSYAIPALVAIGQARFFQAPPRFAPLRMIRQKAVEPSLAVLDKMQPESGGFLEATPLTSFVVMSLAGTGRAGHSVVQRGVKFLLDSVREDGSWPIDTDLATWNTTLAINALAGAGEDTSQLECWDWVRSCQHRVRHPYTGADPGGWAWTDLTGGVPDVDDTSGALLALANQSATERQESLPAIVDGIRWLLDLQNRDGGWPTFCRGWGTMPFDRSGTDLTAHALRAIDAWLPELPTTLSERAKKATARGFRFLASSQRADGSWLPLWFGNQHQPDDENPIYGTAKVLAAYRDLNRCDDPAAVRGFEWLLQAQNADGGWGGGPPLADDGSFLHKATAGEANHADQVVSSVEETALATEALLALLEGSADEKVMDSVGRGLSWLAAQVECGGHRKCSPIGFYFAKLWYYERLYPTTFAAATLGRAVRLLAPASTSQPKHARPANVLP